MNEPPPFELSRPAGAARRSWRWVVRAAVTVAVVAGVAAAAYVTRDRWRPVLFPVGPEAEPDEPEDTGATAPPSEQIRLSEQAQKNLRLTTQPLTPDTFWKTISVPGMVIDRPGFSDRGVVAPVTGVVSRIHKIAGDSARPGEPLFTLKLLSEILHQTQTDLFKATQDITLAEAQRKRLVSSAGVVAESRVIDVDNQITRLQVAVKAYRQELLNRGLLPNQIDAAAAGQFVSEISIDVPTRAAALSAASSAALASEVEEVKVSLGQLVQAGQTLCTIANHQMLAVEGRAFRDEAPLLERVVKAGWSVEVDFEEEPGHGWDALGQTFRVNYIANTIDPESRTFRFLLPLDNQSRAVEHPGGTQTLWRFRPGQRVRLHIRVEKLEDVFVLPPEAVARDGADAYVFRQNGDVFDRKPVRVVYQDRDHVVVANDGSVPPGLFVAQTGAAQLNRMIKSQSGTTPKGFHIHADGSVHMGKH